MTDDFIVNVARVKKDGNVIWFKNRRIKFDHGSLQFLSPKSDDDLWVVHCEKIQYKPMKLPTGGKILTISLWADNENDDICLMICFNPPHDRYMEWVVKNFNKMIEENKDKMQSRKAIKRVFPSACEKCGKELKQGQQSENQNYTNDKTMSDSSDESIMCSKIFPGTFNYYVNRFGNVERKKNNEITANPTSSSSSISGAPARNPDESSSTDLDLSNNQMSDEFIVDVSRVKRNGKVIFVKNWRIKFDRGSLHFLSLRSNDDLWVVPCEKIQYKPMNWTKGSKLLTVWLWADNENDDVSLKISFKPPHDQYMEWVVKNFNKMIEENKDKMRSSKAPKRFLSSSAVSRSNISSEKYEIPSLFNLKACEMERNENNGTTANPTSSSSSSTSGAAARNTDESPSTVQDLSNDQMTDAFIVDVLRVKRNGKVICVKHRRIKFDHGSLQFLSPKSDNDLWVVPCEKILYKPMKPPTGKLLTISLLADDEKDDVLLKISFRTEFAHYIEWVVKSFNKMIEENKDKMQRIKETKQAFPSPVVSRSNSSGTPAVRESNIPVIYLD